MNTKTFTSPFCTIIDDNNKLSRVSYVSTASQVSVKLYYSLICCHNKQSTTTILFVGLKIAKYIFVFIVKTMRECDLIGIAKHNYMIEKRLYRAICKSHVDFSYIYHWG